MYRRIIAAAAAAALAVSSGLCALAQDKPEYSSDIDFVTTNRIMQGNEKGELNLDDTITRAEFVKMLITAAQSGELDSLAGDTEVLFRDVPETHWAKEYIDKAAACGFINGYEDGSFRPENNVTYVQAIKILLAVCGIDTQRTDYPYGYLSAALDNGLLEGIDLDPDMPIKRGETARLMYNAYNSTENGVLNASGMVMNGSEAVAGDDGSENRYYGYGLFRQTELYKRSNFTVASGSGGGGGSASTGMAAPSESGGSAMSNAYTDAAGAIRPGGIETAVNPWYSAEEYTQYEPNSFRKTALTPLSTFSIDTDTASYSNMRRFISLGRMPEKGSIRTEELINYFDYAEPELSGDSPFGVMAQITDCPWSENKLARITAEGGAADTAKPSNLVFLIDVSGSMSSYNKLPMLKKALLMMLEELDKNSTVSVVTYASGVRTVLEPTSCTEREVIEDAVSSLTAGGGTNGADGLALAYETVERSRIDGGNNRIILCSDGDFNIGPSSTDELKELITEKRKAGIYLTTMGFGMGNYKDNRMELMADCGNGSYYYIDSMREAKRVFADELPKTLYTVADDVKLQVEFNPAVVSEYRLIGYENRQLKAEDFENDKIDAGELGAGAGVTAIYELVMKQGEPAKQSGEYRYQTAEYSNSNEAFDVKIRYKNPGEEQSILKEFPVENVVTPADDDTKFAASVAMLGLKLNGVIDVDYETISALARESVQTDGSYSRAVADRWEFIQLTELLRYIDR